MTTKATTVKTNLNVTLNTFKLFDMMDAIYYSDNQAGIVNMLQKIVTELSTGSTIAIYENVPLERVQPINETAMQLFQAGIIEGVSAYNECDEITIILTFGNLLTR